MAAPGRVIGSGPGVIPSLIPEAAFRCRPRSSHKANGGQPRRGLVQLGRLPAPMFLIPAQPETSRNHLKRRNQGSSIIPGGRKNECELGRRRAKPCRKYRGPYDNTAPIASRQAPCSLFPKPRPNDLLTVRCCEECRTGWSKDDEYFAFAAATAASLHEAPEAMRTWEHLFRGLGSKKKLAFFRYLQKQTKTFAAQTPAGIYLGECGRIELDSERINRVGARIIRALFFREYERLVPPSHDVRFLLFQFSMEHVTSGVAHCSFESRTYADGQFRYQFRATAEDPDSSMWHGDIYGVTRFCGFTFRHRAEETT